MVLCEGDWVEHVRRPQWGAGMVVEVSERLTTVCFEDGLLRKFKRGFTHLLRRIRAASRRTVRPAPADVETFLLLARRRHGLGTLRLGNPDRRAPGDWRPTSLLRDFGYNVSEQEGLREQARQDLLEDFLYCELPRQWEGRAEWGEAATLRRLRKMLSFLRRHCADRAEGRTGMARAVARWRADADWLEETFSGLLQA